MKINIISLFVIFSLFAASHILLTPIYKEYDLAVELVKINKFRDAEILFEKIIRNPQTTEILKTDALFYKAKCGFYNNNNDTDKELLTFIINNPSHRAVNEAYFLMGKFQYKKKNFKKTIEYFKKVSPFEINELDKIEYNFKMGYSYLKIDSNNLALSYFYKVIEYNYVTGYKQIKKDSISQLYLGFFYKNQDIESNYKIAALYYYSHLEYLNKNFKTALSGFEEACYDIQFAKVAPLYVLKIYYHLGDYEKAIEKGKTLLQKEELLQRSDVFKIVGESYMSKARYSDAIEYLLRYKNSSKFYTREDNYNLAYTYYKTDDLASASEFFKKASEGDDLLAQNAYYFLADCYLKSNNKTEAQKAFLMASKLQQDSSISEDAMFNHAKITYELRNKANYGEAITLFNYFIEKYPKSSRLQEATDYLVNAVATSSNYKDALSYLKELKNKDVNILRIEQKIAYNRAIELFNNNEFEEAVKNFDYSISLTSISNTIIASSLYWKAEAQYKQGLYQDAISTFQMFLITPGAFQLPEYNLAYYSTAYSYFKQDKFSTSAIWFKKYLNNCKDISSEVLADSYLRVADCYFLSKEYSLATAHYEAIEKLNSDKKDYAMFQSGITLGLQNLYAQKINILNTLLEQYPKSPYNDDALFELGKTFWITNRTSDAVKSYKKIYSDYEYSSYAPKARLQLGLIAYNKRNYDEALSYYKSIIDKTPKTQEAQSALLSIKNIYIETNKIDDYFKYVESNDSLKDITIDDKDQLNYEVAERLYLDEKYDEAKDAFGNYIKQFAKGQKIIEANYYRAECLSELKLDKEALPNYEFVCNMVKSDYLIASLKRASSISFENKDFEKSVKYYKMLEENTDDLETINDCYYALMFAYKAIDSTNQTLEYAQKVINYKGTTLEQQRQALYFIAKAYEKDNDLNNSLEAYKKLSIQIKTAEGAEAKYSIAKIYFNQELYELSEKEILDFSKNNSSQQYWLAKSFIILGDIYIIRKDFFQAKATYESILTNYKGKDTTIFLDIRIKLAEIKKAEKQKDEEELDKQKQGIELDLSFKQNTNIDYSQIEIGEDEIKDIKIDIKKEENTKKNDIEKIKPLTEVKQDSSKTKINENEEGDVY